MTLENIYYIGQTVAVFAILGTLIILIVQMRQANRLARNAANREQIDAMKNSMKLFCDTPALAELWVRGNKDPGSLSEAEMLQYASIRLSFWRTWEALHAQHMQGLVDDDLWEAHLMQVKMALNEPGARVVWDRAKPVFTKKFQVFFEEFMPPSKPSAPAESAPKAGAPKSQENRP